MSHFLIDMPARIALLPLLVAQAVWVRRRALTLPEAAGPRSGAIGDGPPLRLLILGDSSAAGVGAVTQEDALSGQLAKRLSRNRQVIWQLEAQTGDTTKDALARLDRMRPAQFDLAVVALGVNDVTRAVPLEVWLRRQRRMIDVLQDRFGVTQICLSGLPPMGAFPLLPHPLRWVLGRQAERFDRHLRALADAADAVSVTPLVFDLSADHMAEDGYHPGPAVYAAWADMLIERIQLDRIG